MFGHFVLICGDSVIVWHVFVVVWLTFLQQILTDTPYQGSDTNKPNARHLLTLESGIWLATPRQLGLITICPNFFWHPSQSFNTCPVLMYIWQPAYSFQKLEKKSVKKWSWVGMFSSLHSTHIPLITCRCMSHHCWYKYPDSHVPGHMHLNLNLTDIVLGSVKLFHLFCFPPLLFVLLL